MPVFRIEKNENYTTMSNCHLKDPRHKYGEYSNVLLTDSEYQSLRQEFPRDYRQRIEVGGVTRIVSCICRCRQEEPINANSKGRIKEPPEAV